jgi:hypothetical protein
VPVRHRWHWLVDRGLWLIGRWRSLSGRLRWLTAGTAIALVALVGVFVISSYNESPGSAAQSTTTGAHSILRNFAPAHRSSSSNTPEAALAAVRVTPKLAVALRRWNAGRGGAVLAQVSADLGDALQAAGSKLFVQMKPACSSLAAAVSAAKSAPPMPSAPLQKLYVKTLVTLEPAAADCLDGISEHAYGDDGVETHKNPTTLSRSVSELTAGSKDLYLATLKLAVVQRR